MIKSMTGFGKATRDINDKKFTVEVKSLNSKQLDLNVRLPGQFREKEVALRNHVSSKIQRGKVDLLIYFDAASEDKSLVLNKELALHYYNGIKELASSFDPAHQPSDYLAAVLKMPEVLKSEKQEVDEGEWKEILSLAEEAIAQFDNFRVVEGKALEADILSRVVSIKDALTEIEPFEQARIDYMRERIQNSLADLKSDEKYDKNRFEQELIYYIEKFDINEEKVRLTSHCKLFLETASENQSQGKKLGFISQEIGREVNTIGSKANNADIQKVVVRMKDDLEKIKEQVLNVL